MIIYLYIITTITYIYYIYIYILGVPEKGVSPHIAVGKISPPPRRRWRRNMGTAWCADAWCDPKKGPAAKQVPSISSNIRSLASLSQTEVMII
jgi:hypothetical protein